MEASCWRRSRQRYQNAFTLEFIRQSFNLASFVDIATPPTTRLTGQPEVDRPTRSLSGLPTNCSGNFDAHWPAITNRALCLATKAVFNRLQIGSGARRLHESISGNTLDQHALCRSDCDWRDSDCQCAIADFRH